jgi:hypothetical protein
LDAIFVCSNCIDRCCAIGLDHNRITQSVHLSNL